MSNNWDFSSLGNHITLQRGFDLPSHKRIEGKVPVVSSSGITGYHSEAKINGPGVVTGRYGTIGKVFYIEKEFWPLNTTLFVKDFKGNDPKFISYLLQTINYGSVNAKSSVPGINRNDLHEIKVKVPSTSIQKRIANILGDLDNKIDINKRINQTLDDMAMALYEHWFANFIPFKDGEFENSELGLIPKGWKAKKVKDVIELKLGGTPSRRKPEYWGGDIPWINSGKVNEFRIVSPSEYITEEGLRKSATKLLPKKTTVLAITGATLGQISRLEIEACANQSVIGLLENELFSSEFIYLWLNYVIDELLKQQTGGAQQHINKGNVGDLYIILPENKIINEFKNIIEPLFEQISANCLENEKLKQIRDYLLPRLMSGEIKLVEAEKNIVEVL